MATRLQRLPVIRRFIARWASRTDFDAALDGDVDAYRRLQEAYGRTPSQADIDGFIARGGPRLLSTLRQMELIGIQIDPDSNFAVRLDQFRRDVEAATNGDVEAFVRLSQANGIALTPKQINDFVSRGGPPLLPTMKQRALLGIETDPLSAFGIRWATAMGSSRPPRSAGVQPAGNMSSPVSTAAAAPGDSGGEADDLPFGPGRTALPKEPAAEDDTPISVSMGSGIGQPNGVGSWWATGQYQNGVLTVTKTKVVNSNGDTQDEVSTSDGDEARRSVAAALEAEAHRAAADAKAKADEQAAADRAAKDKAKKAAEDASADPEPGTASAYTNPDAGEAGGPGTVGAAVGPPPSGQAGKVPFGGDFGNPMFAQFIGGSLVISVSAGPDVDPNAAEGGVPGTATDPTTGRPGVAPFGGDYGNPNGPTTPAPPIPIDDDGSDPYADEVD